MRQLLQLVLVHFLDKKIQDYFWDNSTHINTSPVADRIRNVLPGELSRAFSKIIMMIMIVDNVCNFFAEKSNFEALDRSKILSLFCSKIVVNCSLDIIVLFYIEFLKYKENYQISL